MSQEEIVERILAAPAKERPRLLRENLENVGIADLNRISDSLLTDIHGTIERINGQNSDVDDEQAEDTHPEEESFEYYEEANIFSEDDSKVDYLEAATRAVEASSKNAPKKEVTALLVQSNAPEAIHQPVATGHVEAAMDDKPEATPLILSESQRVLSEDDAFEEIDAKEKTRMPKRPTLAAPVRSKAERLQSAVPLASQEELAVADKKRSAFGFGKLANLAARLVLLSLTLLGPIIMVYLCDKLGTLGLQLSSTATIGVSAFAGIQTTFSILLLYNFVQKRMPWILVILYVGVFALLCASIETRDLIASII